MGKKRITTTEETTKKAAPAAGADSAKSVSTEKSATIATQSTTSATPVSTSKKRIDTGVLYVQSTYNNTKLIVTDTKGNMVAWSSSGSLGFKGAKKGTPFAAAKVGETLAAKLQPMGLKEVSVVVKGVGSGRESAIRGFISKGINLITIKDKTPVPFNGPKPPRPRRV